MFTKDQLDQFRTVIREEIDSRIGKTENRIDLLDAKIEQLELKTEKRFEQLETKLEIYFSTLKKQQDQDRKDWIAFFHEAGLFFDEMREQLAKRLTRIEDHLGFSKN
jgi:chromosome segregation ATPase